MTTNTVPPDGSDADQAESPTIPSWDDLGVSKEVGQALADLGYLEPMPVQAAVYEHMSAGKDMMVQARTGTGKTAAFGIPAIEAVEDAPGVRTLILTPTRELALQVHDELRRLASFKSATVVPIYGGAPIRKQIDQLAAGAQIVAGTPGRVLDHIRRKTLDTSTIKMLVLDECDEMLSMGFQEEIEAIISYLPGKEERQTLLFSATIPGSIERIAAKHLTDPEKVELSEGGISVKEIDHGYYIVSGMARMRDLLKVLTYEDPESAIIFCNTRDETSTVAKYLNRHGLDAEHISSDLSQKDRERVMGLMRDKKLRFLVATDVAARGIDISDLPYVINYTFPESAEVYVHRTGRTGRAGNRGIALSLVGPREIGSFYYLKLLYKIQPEERELPGNEVIAAAMEGEKVRKIAKQVEDDAGEEYRRLARRLWESEDGERVVASLLKRYLTGALRSGAKRVRNEGSSDTGESGDGRQRRRRRGRDGDGDSDSSRPDRPRRERSARSRDDESGSDEPRRRKRRRRRDRDGDDSGRGQRSEASGSEHDAETVVMNAESETVVMDADAVSSMETVVVEPSSELLDASSESDDDDKKPRKSKSRKTDEGDDKKKPRRSRSKKDDVDEDDDKKSRRSRSKKDDEGDDKKPPRRSRSKKDDVDEDDDKKSGRSRSKKDDEGDDKKPPRRSRSKKDDGGKKRSRRSKKDTGSDKEFWEAWADEKQSRSDTDDGDSEPAGDGDGGATGGGTGDGDGDETVRLYVNIGKREDLNADEIRDLLIEGLDDDVAEQIGTIALKNTHCYVRVPEDLVETVISGAEGKSVKDRDVVVERARR